MNQQIMVWDGLEDKLHVFLTRKNRKEYFVYDTDIPNIFVWCGKSLESEYRQALHLKNERFYSNKDYVGKPKPRKSAKILKFPGM